MAAPRIPFSGDECVPSPGSCSSRRPCWARATSTYDYAPGGLTEASARLRRGDLDLVAIDYRLQLVRSINGISRNTRVQRFTAEGQVPVESSLAVGGGWAWDERLASYDELPSVRRSAGEWRLFLSWLLK